METLPSVAGIEQPSDIPLARAPTRDTIRKPLIDDSPVFRIANELDTQREKRIGFLGIERFAGVRAGLLDYRAFILARGSDERGGEETVLGVEIREKERPVLVAESWRARSFDPFGIGFKR